MTQTLLENNEMNKLKPLVLIAVLLVSACFVSTAAATRIRSQLPPVATFNLSATGHCLAASIEDIGEEGGFEGTGSLIFNGSAQVQALAAPAASIGGFYEKTRLFAPVLKSASASWNGESISMTFDSKDSSSAMFIVDYSLLTAVNPQRDYVLLGTEAGFGLAPPTMLQYTALLTDASGNHVLNGKAIVESEPYSNGGTPGDLIIVGLFDFQGNLLYEFAWFSQTETLSIGDSGLTIHAADSFVSSVSISGP